MAASKKRPALGKGLSSLLAIEPADQRTNKPIVADSRVFRSQIVPNPFQPRIDFDSTAIDELADSIKKQGLLQPIVIRKAATKGYEIISGERRFRAMTKLSWDKIPVIIRDDVNDTQMLELALVENLQRENLNDIETALSYEKLLETCKLSHQELSEQVGKSRSAISNTLRLLKLPLELQQLVREGKLSMGHARALLGCTDTDLQMQLADEVVNLGISVRAIEQKVKSGEVPVKEGKDPSTKFVDLEMALSKKLSVSVHIKGSSEKKGKFELSFKSEDEFKHICSILYGN